MVSRRFDTIGMVSHRLAKANGAVQICTLRQYGIKWALADKVNSDLSRKGVGSLFAY
jgi:hypothetical protein